LTQTINDKYIHHHKFKVKLFLEILIFVTKSQLDPSIFMWLNWIFLFENLLQSVSSR